MQNIRAVVVASVAAAAVAVSTLAVGAPAQAAPLSNDTHSLILASATPEQRAIVERLDAVLPSDWQDRLAQRQEEFDVEHSPVQEAVLSKQQQSVDAVLAGQAQAIDPTAYECNATLLDAYVDEILAEVDPITLLILSLYGGLDLPTYEALLLGKPGNPDFAVDAEFRAPLTATFTASQKFWDVRLDDVQLLGMHGEMVTDVDRSAATAQVLYEMGPTEAVEFAQTLKELVESEPALKGGANPLFTLNAFAFSAEGETDPVIRKLKDKVVVGDGILDALVAMRLGATGAKAVLGHEMAHHVQYENDLFDSDLPAPEATRRTELMADGFAAYFSTHKKGLAMKPAQILLVQQSFYNVGDCGFDNPGHHGTPNQRRAAASWGVAEVAYATNPNRQLPSMKLYTRFEKVLPQLIAPDAAPAPSTFRSSVQLAERQAA